MSVRRAERLDVTLWRADDPGRGPGAWWEARRATGGVVRGGHMPLGKGVVPHDLAHLATEATLGLRHGFWGLLAAGATFKHGTAQRATRPGRALVAAHRAELAEAEALGNHHHTAWMRGEPTPVGAALDRLAAAWADVPPGGAMTVRWPSLDLVDVDVDVGVDRAASHAARGSQPDR